MDHLSKLRAPTIEAISRLLEPELGLFGYGVRRSVPLRWCRAVDEDLRVELTALKRAILGLAEQNGMRIEETRELSRENGYRSDEVARLTDRINSLASIADPKGSSGSDTVHSG